MKYLMLFSVLVACTDVASAADWSVEAVVEESVYQTSHVVDTLQTIQIGKSRGRYYETESCAVIGEHPRVGQTLAFMGAIGAGHALITNAMVNDGVPSWVVRAWEVVAIGWSAGHVAHNYSIGIKMKL